MKAIFKSSEGWNECPAIRSHRCAPPCENPIPGTNTSKFKITAKTKKISEYTFQNLYGIRDANIRAIVPRNNPKKT